MNPNPVTTDTLHRARRLIEDRIGDIIDSLAPSNARDTLADAAIAYMAGNETSAQRAAIFDNTTGVIEPLRECIRCLNRLEDEDGCMDDTDAGGDEFRAMVDEILSKVPPAPAATLYPEEYNEGSPRYYDLPVGMAGFDDAGGETPVGSLVPDFADRGELIIVSAPPGNGKTFFAFDLAMHLASGATWRGHALRRVGVLYVALEGSAGLMGRLEAWKVAHPQVKSAAIAICKENLCLADQDGASRLLKIARSVQRGMLVPLGLIVIDTLARGLQGHNENQGEVMGAVIECASRLQQEFGAAVALLHHPGRDASRGPRGHSSLAAAADTILEISTDAAGNRSAVVIKRRDGACGQSFPFTLVPSGASAVVSHCTEAPPKRSPARRAAVDHVALLVSAVADAEAAGRPLYYSGLRGLHERLDELPKELRSMKRDELRRVAAKAVDAGHIAHIGRGPLTIPQQAQTTAIH